MYDRNISTLHDEPLNIKSSDKNVYGRGSFSPLPEIITHWQPVRHSQSGASQWNSREPTQLSATARNTVFTPRASV